MVLSLVRPAQRAEERILVGQAVVDADIELIVVLWQPVRRQVIDAGSRSLRF